MDLIPRPESKGLYFLSGEHIVPLTSLTENTSRISLKTICVLEHIQIMLESLTHKLCVGIVVIEVEMKTLWFFYFDFDLKEKLTKVYKFSSYSYFVIFLLLYRVIKLMPLELEHTWLHVMLKLL